MDKFDFDRPRNLDAGRTVRDYDEWAFESFYGNGIAGLPRYRKSGKRVSLLDEALFRFDEHERDLSEGGIAWSFGTEYRSMLNEGLILSWDIKKVLDFLKGLMEKPSGEFDFITDIIPGPESRNMVIPITVLVYKNTESSDIDRLKQSLKVTGWYIAGRGGSRYRELDKIVLEPKYSVNVTDMIYKSGKMLYHVTPAKNFRHISGKGLIPRSYNKRSDYPDRIYFRMRPDENFVYDNMARELDPHINEWALLEIDLSQVPDRRYSFYRDPDSEGVYTYDNINPRCITLKRIIKT